MKNVKCIVNRDVQPLIKVNILNKEYLALLDSGAALTLIGDEVHKDLINYGYPLRKTTKLFSTVNGICEADGQYTIPLKFGNMKHVRRHKCYVIHGLPIILLGRDFMSKFRITCSFLPENPHWKFADQEFPFAKPNEPIKDKKSRALQANFVQNVSIKDQQSEIVDYVSQISLETCKEENRAKVTKVLYKNQNVFNPKPGRTNLVEFEMELLPGAKLSKQHPFKFGPVREAACDLCMDEAIKEGYIRPSKSPHCVPTIVVMKDGKKPRMVNAFGRTNDITASDTYPLPLLRQIFDSLGTAKYYTVLDLTKGFYQIPIREKDKWLTSFVNGRGLWEYNVMPFGVKNAPATFQRLMDEVLGGKERNGYCLCYIDDVIIFSDTFEDHLKHLDDVLTCIAKAGLTINPAKVQICTDKIEYLGMIVEPGSMTTSPKKVNAILNFPTPTNTKEVQRFMGIYNFVRVFVPQVSTTANPLHALQSPKNKFIWTPQCEKAFQQMKLDIVEYTKLYLPDRRKPFYIRTDASDVGIGAVLMQYDLDNVLHPVSYVSRSLSKAEKNYSTCHKECLGVIYALHKFRPYVEYTRFTVETDHQALQWLRNIKDPTGKLARWSADIQEFDMEVLYRKGSDNEFADALSRAPVDLPPAVEESDTASADAEKISSLIGAVETRETAKRGKQFKNSNFKPSKLNGPHPEIELHSLILSQEQDSIIKPCLDYIRSDKQTLPQDPKLRAKVITMAEDAFVFDNGLLVKYIPSWRLEDESFESNFKIVVPKSLQILLMTIYHDHPLSGHQHHKRTLLRLTEKYTWIGISTMVKLFCKTCLLCQKVNPSNKKPAGFMDSHRPNFPWEIIALDLVGPLPLSHNGFQYVLVIVDVFSRWVECFPLKTKNSQIITERLFETCCRFGFPRIVISDNGSEFTSQSFDDICRTFRIDTKHSPPYWPQANPTERQNRNIKSHLRKFTEKHKN
jgi:hypothetical protein